MMICEWCNFIAKIIVSEIFNYMTQFPLPQWPQTAPNLIILQSCNFFFISFIYFSNFGRIISYKFYRHYWRFWKDSIFRFHFLSWRRLIITTRRLFSLCFLSNWFLFFQRFTNNFGEILRIAITLFRTCVCESEDDFVMKSFSENSFLGNYQ